MVISVSTLALSSSAAFSAISLRRLPSNENGLVTTPIVSAPASLAISATTGAAPEPVPPPRPAVMNTMSESVRASAILSRSSSAARAPIVASPPAPRPRVILSPMRILCGASDWRSAWASVLQAMNSTPIISARIIRLTALLPPPPTPMTRIRAKFSESDRSGIGALPGLQRLARGWVGVDGLSVQDPQYTRVVRHRIAPVSGPVRGRPYPARNDSRTRRLALSSLGSSRVIDCHCPSASTPPITGTESDGEASSGSTWSAPCPAEPWR